MKLVADPPDDRRGLSPVVGIILLFGMVLMGATLVAIGGMSLIDTMQTESSLDQAETSMQQTGADLRDLSYSPDENRTSVETSDGARLTDDAKVTLTVNDNPDRSATVTLGSLQYEADSGETVTLEGDGVFRSTSNGSYVVSPPALTLRDGRLSFPVTKLNGSVDGGDSLTASKNASVRSLGDELLGSGLAPSENVTITVQSAHYDAWGRYLAKQADKDPADVIDHDDESATVTYALGTDDDTTESKDGSLIWAEDDSPGAETKHHVRYTVEEGSVLVGKSLETIEIDYQTDDIDVSGVGDNGKTLSNKETGIDTNSNGKIDEELPGKWVHPNNDIYVSDKSSTLAIDLGSGKSNNNDLTLEAGDTFRLTYDSGTVVNPNTSGSYDTTVSLNGVKKSGELVIGSAGADNGGTVEEDEDTNAIEVNQDSATLTFVGSEIAQAIDKNEVERKPLDVVFTLDRSGSMADYPISVEDFRPETGPMTIEEALEEGYIEESESGLDYRVTEGGHMPFVKADDGGWGPITYHTAFGMLNLGNGDQVYFDDPHTEIQIRVSGSDPNEQRIDATQSFLDALNGSAGDRAALTEFNSDGNTIQGLSSPETVKSNLDANAQGGTDIAAGIREAIEEYESDSDHEKAIVLLSDGENSVVGEDTEDLNEDARNAAEDAAEENISIYTVGLGDADAKLLKDIKDITGGGYYSVDDADELESVFDEIAGETIQDRTKQIEYQSVTSAVQVDGKSYTLTPDGDLSDSASDRDTTNVNDPSSEPPTYDIDDGVLDLGSLVSANVAAYECEESEPTGETVTDDGEVYEKTRCIESSETKLDEVDNSVSDHMVYTDGDHLNEFDGRAWYQKGQEALLEEYDPSLIEDGELALSENQAVIVTKLSGTGSGTDYAMMLLEVDEPETETPSDDSSLIDMPVDEIELEG